MTWLCGPGIPPSTGPAVERSLRFENDVVMTFPAEAGWGDAGLCVRLMDPVEAGLLDDAFYRYHLRWNQPGDNDPIEKEADLP